MSLYLGRLGRKIVDFSITNKTTGKILNGIGRGINHLSSNYVVGLTRESFMLSQRVKAGNNIDIKSDGFYVGERQVLPSAQLARNLLDSGTSKFSIDNMFSEPENLARAFRTILNGETSLRRMAYALPTFAFSFGIDQMAKFSAERGIIFDTCVKHYVYNSMGSDLPGQDFFCLHAVDVGGDNFSLTKFFLGGVVLTTISLFYYLAVEKATLWHKLGFGLFLGGFFSNYFDIMRQGYGVNYLNIDLPLWHGTFNSADVSLELGLLMILPGVVKMFIKEGKAIRRNILSPRLRNPKVGPKGG